MGGTLHPPPLVSATASITNQNLKLENFWKLIFISIKSWLYAYIYFHLYHHPGILVIFFSFSIFFNSVYLCSKHSLYFWCTYVVCIVYLYFMWLIMVLIKSTLLFSFVETAMQMCTLLCHNCVQYICLLAHFFGKRDDNTANIWLSMTICRN